ncbi:MAG: DNA translocase FtsK [Flavobacteriaceae bacterium]|nr:DNA translocase FtsK [Flavobacteriaceae bacterium]
MLNKKTLTEEPDGLKKTSSKKKRSREIIIGGFLILIAILLFLSFISFFLNWKTDFTSVEMIFDRTKESANILKKIGAWVSHIFIYNFFGVSSFIIPFLLFITGFVLFFNLNKTNILINWIWGLYYTLWSSILFGMLDEIYPILGGLVGFEISQFIVDYIGEIGLISLLTFGALLFIVLHWKITPELIYNYLLKIKKTNTEIIDDTSNELVTVEFENKKETLENKAEINKKSDIKSKSDELDLEINKISKEQTINKLSQDLVDKLGEFDPKLGLSKFKSPSFDLLKDYGDGSITINEEELELNKNKIVETLKNYKIEIAQIKANIGPTVTLYEIVPAAGIRISKIKNLEDDIALSLSALGIRIIAPIPGKGTIGIEVPNQNPSIVSMKSVVLSQKFQKAQMDLPIALGKNISNETFVVDLSKMPHLLMAGATGQGKSVGINALLTSLLYKKHPSEVKFVLVDPKKVELNIYNKIEKHYLAKLPDSEEAIITDNTKVIYTLNSLCIEMENRYELLKNANCRNIKEYNLKFKNRKLNPDDGHAFLPYIILIIDEFADLIMTAGKEVETPIARLAQLARAIGIHLIIATQRPSVNVITGVIKANFPARIAFRVTSKIDSRTILDNGGADQLIGRGDMLYTQGNELTRIQCAFIDTPEVEKITNFIGTQTGYNNAHLLPEYKVEENTKIDVNIDDRDVLFREAAEVIVTAQQGSASLLQRKLKLGYNRAGRIIDQMEAAGIVGPFEGSKPRQVLVQDLMNLDKILNDDVI